MELKICAAEFEDKLILRNLLELYQHDHSEFDGDDVNSYGRYGYRYLDHYWTEPGRFAFIINIAGNIAGFALVRQHPSIDKLNTYSMAEFFVMRKYRGRGVGQKVAQSLFDRFPGRWQVRQAPRNLPAQAFWRKIIGAYTQNDFEEFENLHQTGPTQIFVSRNQSTTYDRQVDIKIP